MLYQDKLLAASRPEALKTLASALTLALNAHGFVLLPCFPCLLTKAEKKAAEKPLGHLVILSSSAFGHLSWYMVTHRCVTCLIYFQRDASSALKGLQHN